MSENALLTRICSSCSEAFGAVPLLCPSFPASPLSSDAPTASTLARQGLLAAPALGERRHCLRAPFIYSFPVIAGRPRGHEIARPARALHKWRQMAEIDHLC